MSLLECANLAFTHEDAADNDASSLVDKAVDFSGLDVEADVESDVEEEEDVEEDEAARAARFGCDWYVGRERVDC